MQIDNYLKVQGREPQIVGAYRVTGAALQQLHPHALFAVPAPVLGARASALQAARRAPPACLMEQAAQAVPAVPAACADEVAMRGAIEVAGTTSTLVSAFLSKVGDIRCTAGCCGTLQPH